MPLNRILLAAIGGGVGGALGALLAKGIVPKTAAPSRRTVLALVPVMVGAVLGSQFAVTSSSAPSSRAERAMLRYTEPLLTTPAVKQRFTAAGVDGARSLGQQLSHAGLKRLGAADLDDWNRVRVLLAASSPAICAGLWTGRIDSAVLMAELDRLGDADLDTWARVTGHAMGAELAATEPLVMDPEGTAKTLLAVQERLAPPDRERFGKDLEAGEKLPDAEACWVMQQLMKTVATLEPAPREAALRSLAAL